MATNDWNAIDNYDNNASEHFCAFIDILGYKDKAERFFQGEFNLQGRFNRAMGTTVKLFNLTSCLIDTNQIKVKFFSDSIVITLPELEGSSDGKFGLILFCAILSSHLSFEDLFVRGGISKGAHIESIDSTEFSFLASIALQKAYAIESSIAGNPRIVIDPALVHNLGRVSAETLDYLAMEDDHCFVHFARHLINKEGNNQKIVLQEMIDIQTAMNAVTDERIKDKYRWVLDYYYWTLSTTPNVDITEFSQFQSGLHRSFRVLRLVQH